jgi:hypothetical protein
MMIGSGKVPIWALVAILFALTHGMGSVEAQIRDRDLMADDDAVFKGQELGILRQFRLAEIGDGEQNRATIRARLQTALKSRLQKLERLPNLTEAQKKKLELAGRSAINKHIDQLEDDLRKLGQPDQERATRQKLLREFRERNRMSPDEIFGEGSFYAKVLKRTLTPDQIAWFDAADRVEAARRHESIIEWVLGTWDQSLKLRSNERERLGRFLREHTRPPRKTGEYDYYGILLQLARLPEGTLKSLFNDEQWSRLTPQIAAAKGLEDKLKEDGYLPTKDVASAPRPGEKPPANAEKKRG